MWLKIIYRWLENTVHIWWLRCLLRFKASALYIYIAAWQIMHGSEQFFEKNNSPIATHPDADADLQSQTVRLAIIYIKCIIQTAYKRHKKGIKGYSPELQRKRADVLLKSQSPS